MKIDVFIFRFSKSSIPCKVCSSPYNVKLHYGIIICNACACHVKKRKLQDCKFDRKCKVDTKLPWCAYCRFKKALSLGLNIDVNYPRGFNKIKPKTYSPEKLNEIMKVLVEGGDLEAIINPCLICQNPRSAFHLGVQVRGRHRNHSFYWFLVSDDFWFLLVYGVSLLLIFSLHWFLVST